MLTMQTFNKSLILKTLLLLWLFASTFYFLSDQYYRYKNRILQNSYQQGYVASILEIIEKNKQSDCKGFSLKNGDEELGLIDMKCLQTQVENSK